MKHDEPRWSRRGLLCGGATLVTGALLARHLCREPRPSAVGAPLPSDEPVLLLLEISGGNDGLSTLVPFADAAYRAARPRTAIPAEAVLRIDEKRGFHPLLGVMHERYTRGTLAVVEGVGYPEPNLSHFTSQDIWYTGRERGRVSGEGWIGRVLRAKHAGDVLTPHAVHVGPNLPYSMTSSTHPIVHLGTPAAYRWVGDASQVGASAAASASSGDSELVGGLRSVARGAENSSRAIRAAIGKHKTAVGYPDTDLGRELRIAAALLHARIGIDVLSVTQGGYDTHDDQRARQNKLYTELDAALRAFLAHVEGTTAGDRLVIVLFSEFGRRVADNASQGTDHGTAGPMLLLGKQVRGGLYGAPCSLANQADGNLIHTTDFRSVYASVLDGWLSVSSAEVLGAAYPKLPLFT